MDNQRHLKRRVALAPVSRSRTNSRARAQSAAMESVEAFCRVRTVDASPEQLCAHVEDGSVLVLRNPDEPDKETRCTFQHVFPMHRTQDEVFNVIAKPLLQDLLNGKSALLFAYGVTCSGKTYTVNGEPDHPGVLPNSADIIFNTLNGRLAPKYTFVSDRMNGFRIQSETDALCMRTAENCRTTTKTSRTLKNWSKREVVDDVVSLVPDNLFSVFVSMYEIYNAYVFDLLDEDASIGKGPQSKNIRQDDIGNSYVSGVVEVEVRSAEDVLKYMVQGYSQRHSASTALNAHSSRSHCIFTFRVVQADPNDIYDGMQDRNCLVTSQFSLVDLAGSERTTRTNNHGERQKEAAKINQSLMTLRRCLDILRENQRAGTNNLVPYNESKLTSLFKNFFEGVGRLRMLVCVNPAPEEFRENAFVIQFAESAQEVQTARETEDVRTQQAEHKRRKVREQEVHFQLPDVRPTSSPHVDFMFLFPDDMLCDRPIELASELIQSMNDVSKDGTDVGELQATALRRMVSSHHQQSIQISDMKVLLQRKESEQQYLQKTMTDVDKTNNSLRSQLAALKREVDQVKQKNSTLQRERVRVEVVQAERDIASSPSVSSTTTTSTATTHSARRPPPRTVPRQHLPRAVIPENTSTTTKSDVQNHIQRFEARQNQNFLPVGNIKHKRRSKSCDKWLDHRSRNLMHLDTVMQPVSMVRRRSVEKVTLKDALECNKYALRTQLQNMSGEMEEIIYKGDIVPTPGGGASMIIGDTEHLFVNGGSPGLHSTPRNSFSGSGRKRTSSDTAMAQMHLDRDAVKQRCRGSVQGFGGTVKQMNA